jgi:hypothetical protein
MMNMAWSRWAGMAVGLLVVSWSGLAWSDETPAAPPVSDASMPVTNALPPTTTASPEKAKGGTRAGAATVGARYSDEAQEYFADLLLPLGSPSDTMVFLDLRGTALEDREQELNGGLVLRRLVSDPDLILGANLFYDTRWTENDNTFDQVGIGLEVLSRRVDVRANYYLPLADEQTLEETSSSETSTRTEGGRRITTTTTSIFKKYEEAMEGFDVEVGYWLPFLDRIAPTALFAGYYSFSADHAEDLAGARVRMEARIHPNVTLDAEWFEDKELNGTEYFFGLRVQVPLDFWNGLSMGDRAGGEPPVPALKARMSDMVNRDFRIRTVSTGPVLADQRSTESTRTVSQNKPGATDQNSSTPSVPVGPVDVPNCYLNENGEIICL